MTAGWIATAFAAALSANAAAQELPIERPGYMLLDPVPRGKLREMATDRPNQTDSPTTIDAGRLQVEFGVLDTSVDRSPGARSRVWSVGDINLRLGVLDKLELNVVLSPHVVTYDRLRGTAEARRRGFGDVTVGAKFNLWGNNGGATAFAIKPQLTLPTAARGLGTGHAELAVAVPFTAELPAGFGVSLQPSLLRVRDQANRHYVTGYQAAAALDHDVGPLNAYVEYVFDDTDEDGVPSQQVLDVGATARVTRNLVIDAGVGFGLNEAASDFRFLTGASVRF